MTELYRGLLLVLQSKFSSLIHELRSHIRSYKKNTNDPSNFLDVGVMGFWNLILEIVFTVYGVACMVVGIALTASLAIVFYPFAAVLNAMSSMLRGTSGHHEAPIEESPVIVRKTKNN